MAKRRMDSLRWRVCGRKVAIGRSAAMKIAERERERGEQMAAYRCPFGDHWHVGRPLTMRTLGEIAELLRDRHAAA